MYDPRPVPPDRSLVIPMHQEASRIGATLRVLAAHRAGLGDLELVLVDDGSTDGTAEQARQAVDELDLDARILRLDRNSGKGAAISAGVAAASGRVIAFTDADLAADPEAIDRCFALVEDGHADVVVTSRHLPSSEITDRQPLARRSSSAAFRRLVRFAGLRSVSDSQCGLKAFRGDVARTLFDKLSVQRFAFDVEVLLRAEVAGYHVVEVPIRWRHVEASTLRTVRDGTRMLFDVVRLRTELRGWQPDDKAPVAALLEREHWWYVENRRVSMRAAKRAGALAPFVDTDPQTGALLEHLDAGGTEPVVAAAPNTSVGALDVDRFPTLVTSPTAIAMAGATAGTVFVVDRLEFLQDDAAAVEEAARVLRPGGVVVVTVPANPSLWSQYDVALGHHRRYSIASLRRLMEHAGLEVVEIGYFFAWLTPVTFLLARTPLRFLLLRDAERASFVHRRINTLLRVVVDVELAISDRVRLPFGQSVVVAARKP